MEEKEVFEELTNWATRCIIDVATTFTDVRCLASCVAGIAVVAPGGDVCGRSARWRTCRVAWFTPSEVTLTARGYPTREMRAWWVRPMINTINE